MNIDITLTHPSFNLEVKTELMDDGLTVIFGPSGSGKTSLLRCIAGLEPDAIGQISVKEHAWQHSDQGIFVPTWKRELAYVFQEPSLFSHLSVKKNLLFGLSRHPSSAGKQRLEEAIELLGISHLLSHMPNQLSGGERQRVAIARALASSPNMLLFDEPLASLDPGRKQEFIRWLKVLKQQLRIPFIYVTHSTDELIQLADHLLYLKQGRVIWQGSIEHSAICLNQALLSEHEMGSIIYANIDHQNTRTGTLSLWLNDHTPWTLDYHTDVSGQRLKIYIRANDILLLGALVDRTSSSDQMLSGQVLDIHPIPSSSYYLVYLMVGSHTLCARWSKSTVASINKGDSVHVLLNHIQILEIID